MTRASSAPHEGRSPDRGAPICANECGLAAHRGGPLFVHFQISRLQGPHWGIALDPPSNTKQERRRVPHRNRPIKGRKRARPATVTPLLVSGQARGVGGLGLAGRAENIGSGSSPQSNGFETDRHVAVIPNRPCPPIGSSSQHYARESGGGRMLSEIERQLLHYYSQRERIFRAARRSIQHQRLLALGYIREQSLNIRELVVTLTPAGYAALEDGPGAA